MMTRLDLVCSAMPLPSENDDHGEEGIHGHTAIRGHLFGMGESVDTAPSIERHR